LQFESFTRFNLVFFVKRISGRRILCAHEAATHCWASSLQLYPTNNDKVAQILRKKILSGLSKKLSWMMLKYAELKEIIWRWYMSWFCENPVHSDRHHSLFLV